MARAAAKSTPKAKSPKAPAAASVSVDFSAASSAKSKYDAARGKLASAPAGSALAISIASEVSSAEATWKAAEAAVAAAIEKQKSAGAAADSSAGEGDGATETAAEELPKDSKLHSSRGAYETAKAEQPRRRRNPFAKNGALALAALKAQERAEKAGGARAVQPRGRGEAEVPSRGEVVALIRAAQASMNGVMVDTGAGVKSLTQTSQRPSMAEGAKEIAVRVAPRADVTTVIAATASRPDRSAPAPRGRALGR